MPKGIAKSGYRLTSKRRVALGLPLPERPHQLKGLLVHVLLQQLFLPNDTVTCIIVDIFADEVKASKAAKRLNDKRVDPETSVYRVQTFALK